jgi:hypothetical protein
MGKPDLIVDDVFAQFQQRQRDLLAKGHEVMLGADEIGLMPESDDAPVVASKRSR